MSFNEKELFRTKRNIIYWLNIIDKNPKTYWGKSAAIFELETKENGSHSLDGVVNMYLCKNASYGVFGSRLHSTTSEDERLDLTTKALEELGLAGDNSYCRRNSNMTLRDYMMLVPEELLPNGYMY